MKPYHKYIFNKKGFVGEFDKAYKDSIKNKYDIWEQEIPNTLPDLIAYSILNKVQWVDILDIGCGIGVFSDKVNAISVYGIDISQTAIKVAKKRYPTNYYEVGNINNLNNSFLKRYHDLVIMKETLSYCKEWKNILKFFKGKSLAIFISLYLPKDNKGFIKDFATLKKAAKEDYNIYEEVFINNQVLQLLLINK